MILVTGANGFVGRHIVHRLRSEETPVRALVRTPGDARTLSAWGAQLAVGDMTDADSLRRATDGTSAVIHLVAIRQGKPEQFQRIMTKGTADLLEAAQDAGVRRFVHMSALGTSEETKGLVPYYRAKWDMEQAVATSGLEHVVFRPSFIFARDGGILPTFRRLARLAPVTPITGPGTQRIQPIWIDDVAEYFARGLDLDAAANRTWELGGPDAISWNEFWQRLKEVLGVRRPSVHVPIGFMRLNALLTERLPGNVPLTRDLLKMLEGPDNVVTSDDAPRTFGIDPLPLDQQLRRAA